MPGLIPEIVHGDWYSVDRALRVLATKLGPFANPTYTTLTIGGHPVTATLIGNWNTAYASSHVAATISDSTSINFSISGQEISGVVLPAGVDHNSLLNYSADRHFLQTDITSVASALTGILVAASGALSAITNNSANWDTAYTDRLKWDGGSTGLVVATGRTSLGLGIADSPAFTGLTVSGLSTAGFVKNSAAGVLSSEAFGTSTYIPYSSGTGFSYSANLTFDGTDLTLTGDINADNINDTAWDLKADYAFGANSFTGSGDFSGGAILGTSLESEGQIEAATKFVCGGTNPVADGTYTVGIGGTTNGTITIKGGIITAVQQAVA